MQDVAKIACDLFAEKGEGNGFAKFNRVPNPYLEETSLPEQDWESNCCLSNHLVKLVIKAYWWLA